MVFVDVLLPAGLITGVTVIYLILNQLFGIKDNRRQSGWNYPIKSFFVRRAVKRWKSNLVSEPLLETPRAKQSNGWDCITFRTTSPDGTVLFLSIRKLCGRTPLGEITVHIKLNNGTTYKLPRHPDTLIGAWHDTENGWNIGGLKIQVLEPNVRLRILYNGVLTRVEDNITQHVKMNLIWSVSSKEVRHPQDWSDSLAARALASAQWRENWSGLLNRWDDGNWVQWGAIQGQFQSYDKNGVLDKGEYLRTRGVKERSWAPHGYTCLRRSVTITVAARDGTMAQLHGISHRDVLSERISGCIRYPDYSVENITSTDLFLETFCVSSDAIPKHYTINVSTKRRSVKVILKINEDGGRLLSGVPYQQEMVYRTAVANIDGEQGTGLIELGYESSVESKPLVYITQPTLLKWLSEEEAGEVGYCLPFESRAAACPNYVGGKGASLALLSSVQNEKGYRVPPGFCLTVRALEKHLSLNPKLVEAIKKIEADNENYEENNFKEKCNKTVELFHTTEITTEVREEILLHLNELKKKTVDENLASEIRFAVRSSAVGEDSEALSAAGQNETVLGCISDEDVLKGVQKCWGSMFAFTSVHYRRQNGQQCKCGGGVVVQALVCPRVAGVMFTRHPDAGDPTRLLITANYGLGESVVSGSVEPDTITVTCEEKGYLTISKIELGSKIRRVTTATVGVAEEDVPESDRKIPCLTESEVLRLAQIGISQEELWGAGRDIEWAIDKNEIFLLQARPITSLERWTKAELLHEFDFPIMSDDEFVTFANTGEVMPRPITALTVDMVVNLLEESNVKMMRTGNESYDKILIISHNRVLIALYNTLYRIMGKEIDVAVRLSEMTLYGRKVADEHILRVALHRRRPKIADKIHRLWVVLKSLLMSKSAMKDTIKGNATFNLDKIDAKDPSEMLEAIAKSCKHEIFRFSCNHIRTTVASSASQFIVMSVFLEGQSDFKLEQCHEITTLLRSGDVLSAEVPFRLAKLAKDLEDSGRVEEFRAQNVKDALEWLKKNLPQVYLNVSKFLEEHGHRAIMEFDLYTKPWALKPEELMKVLQITRLQNETIYSREDNTDILASLKTPKKASTKIILRWFLPLCHALVRHRETTKAHLIHGIHKTRIALIHLSRLLVRQWYLPHEDLIFFFRLHELKEYIRTRDPLLLKKASQRRQYYPAWCKLRFSELYTGWPEPLTPALAALPGGDVKIHATSVCAGEVVARACVVKSLSEIGQLQQGDILITQSTDIGWSPYFPLLSGIVTELGGLISHGAVIAREYGLPCIVGASNATDIFKTGDMVRLFATNGTLERIKVEEKSTVNNENVIDDNPEANFVDI